MPGIQFQILCCPHLVLSHIRHIDRLSERPVHMLKNHLRCHAVIPAHLKRIFLIPLGNLRLPCCGVFGLRPLEQLL